MRWLLLTLCALLLAAASVAGALEPVGPPRPGGYQQEASHLLSVVAPLGDFTVGRVANDGYVFSLNDHGRRVGDLVVGLNQEGGERPRVRSTHYNLKVSNQTEANWVLETLVRAANAVVASDGGALPEQPVVMSQQSLGLLGFAAMGAIFLAIILGVWRRGRVTVDVKKAHVIQACVHSSIFIYWSFYWPGVRYQFVPILLMIALAYGADAAFSFGRFGKWTVGLGPLPVVFSTNLFVWLDARGAVLAMVGAFALKTFVRRNGRHIFNPSVAGLTLNAICTIVFPNAIHFGGLFHTLNIAPDNAEWIFLGSLIPLTMFRLTPVSIGSIVGLYYLTDAPGAVRPTLLLMMTLLATDPATTPKTDLGRLLFGLMVGSTYVVFRQLLHTLGQPDDFAKILSVPIPNLLVPQFDLAAAGIVAFTGRKWADYQARPGIEISAIARRIGNTAAGIVPVPNAALVMTWSLLFYIALAHEKSWDFEPALHWTWGTPLVVRDADGVPRCDHNPIFCRPFSFVAEAKAWAAK